MKEKRTVKTDRNILIAFILNLFFSLFELIGGFFTGSVAILSDALHDFGDAASIGVSYFLEKKSKKQPDHTHTYGYLRYSVLGSVITTVILLCGSALVIYGAIQRLLDPVAIDYNGMIVFAVVGAAVNLIAAYVTREGDSLNQRAVNLHMLEDVLGWIVVLVGAVVMRFTDWSFIDPILSICVAIFILINAARNLKAAIDIFLEKTPASVQIDEIKEHLCAMDEIIDVHHIHIRTLDGTNAYATMHIVTDADPVTVKEKVRAELKEHEIVHATLELERSDEDCGEQNCHVEVSHSGHHHHHHHHHHGHKHKHKHTHKCEHEHTHECEHEHDHEHKCGCEHKHECDCKHEHNDKHKHDHH